MRVAAGKYPGECSNRTTEGALSAPAASLAEADLSRRSRGARLPHRLRRILLYGVSRGVTEGLLGGRGLLLATLLGPEVFGGWALFRLATQYSTFVAFGVHRGLEREVAGVFTARMRGSAPPDELSARTTLGFTLAAFLPLALLALAGSFLVVDPRLALGMRGFAAVVVTEQVIAYSFIYLRASGSLRHFATLEMKQAALHLVFVIVGVWLWGLAGAFGGFALASACTLALVLPRVPSRPALVLERLRRLLRIGLPLVPALLTSTALMTADRLAVAAYGGTTLLGYYVFAVSIAGLAASFAWVIRTVVFPEVYGSVDHLGAGEAVRLHLDRTIRPFARLYPPLLGAIALAIGPAVLLLLPQYAAAVPPARLFIFTGATVGFASLGSLGVVAADRQRALPLLSVVALLLNLGLSFLALRSGAGLQGVAAGALLSQAVYGAAILALIASAGGVARPIRFVTTTLLPLMWCASVVFVLGIVFPGAGSASLAGSVILYVVLLLPFATVMRKEVRKLRR